MTGTAGAIRPKTARELGIMQGFPPRPESRPTLDNWDLAPFNRWSFQNVRSLFPTVDVRRGEGLPKQLPYDLENLNAVNFDGFDGRSLSVADWIAESYTDGLLVMRNGRIIVEYYGNDLGPQTQHLGQSLSKSLVGILAGVLHDEGLFDLHAPLSDLVPELSACGYADCTMAQALDMQSGVRFVEDYGVAWSDMTRVDVASGWRPVPAGETRPTIRDIILTLPKQTEHGQRFSYRSIETDVVAWALERAAGSDLASLLSGRIWRKLGCEQDGFFTVDAAGSALADGGFNATLRDFGRFGQMVLNGGHSDGRRIVPESWIGGICKEMDQSRFGEPYDALSPEGAYRRFFWVHDPKRETFMARGVFGQIIFFDRQADVLVVKLSSWPDYLIRSFSQDAVRACVAICETLASPGA